MVIGRRDGFYADDTCFFCIYLSASVWHLQSISFPHLLLSVYLGKYDIISYAKERHNGCIGLYTEWGRILVHNVIKNIKSICIKWKQGKPSTSSVFLIFFWKKWGRRKRRTSILIEMRYQIVVTTGYPLCSEHIMTRTSIPAHRYISFLSLFYQGSIYGSRNQIMIKIIERISCIYKSPCQRGKDAAAVDWLAGGKPARAQILNHMCFILGFQSEL